MKKKSDVQDIKSLKKEWDDEWKNMPEFFQEDRESIKHVLVHFETAEDMDAFSKIIGRTITMKTKGFFFPLKENKPKKVYIDES
jgi:hypothetical protein